MTAPLPHLVAFGQAASADGRLFFYKLVGDGDSSFCSMALEMTDLSTAYVAKFTLRDWAAAQQAAGDFCAASPEDNLEFIRTAFNSDRVVEVKGDGEKVRLVAAVRVEVGTDMEHEEEVRVPPRGCLLVQLEEGSEGLKWVCTDLMASMVAAIRSCRRELEECTAQRAAQEQMRTIADFIHSSQQEGGQGGAANGSPPKRHRAAGEKTPVADLGSAMKGQRPAAMAAAAGVGGGPGGAGPSGLPAPSFAAPGPSGQPAVEAGAAAPAPGGAAPAGTAGQAASVGTGVASLGPAASTQSLSDKWKPKVVHTKKNSRARR